MPEPAPARFDDHDRQTLWTSMLSAAGPTAAMSVLLVGYSMAAHVCQASNKPWIAAVIASGIAICLAALFGLRRASRASGAMRFLVGMGLALAAFSICVLVAFALTLTTQVRCD